MQRACAAPTCEGLGECFDAMWDLAMEMLGKGEPVPYERCVRASTGAPPEPSAPASKRRRLADLLASAGHPSEGEGASLLAAADRLARRARRARQDDPGALGRPSSPSSTRWPRGTWRPHLPAPLRTVPRANIRFLPIKDAWFSGSMNYLGRARTPDGKPEYEATYEINASLQISVPEFQQLVSHEVVPGHVTTFAFLQDLFVRGNRWASRPRCSR